MIAWWASIPMQLRIAAFFASWVIVFAICVVLVPLIAWWATVIMGAWIGVSVAFFVGFIDG